MCGIAGIIDPAGLAEGWREDLRALDRSIRHRGPDDHGYFTDQHVGDTPDKLGERDRVVPSPRVLFLHRRLSIIDLSETARQPMVRNDRGVFITYNGEVYNFRELRAELQRDGITFRTQSDTEVVLEAYKRWGIDSVRRLRGIFAFAIADTRKGKVFLVRDHLGVKPLYYAQRGSQWFFTSELKSFRSIRGFELAADPEAIRKYLRFLWIPGNHTGLRSVRKLSPGAWLEIDLATGAAAEYVYWSPLDVDVSRGPIERGEDAVAFVRSEVARVVSQQLVSDVPLGAFLSGGLDSSLIVAAMSHARGDQVSTYSVGYKRADLAYDVVPDDIPYARRVSRYFATDSTEIVLTPDVAALLPTLVETLDEPIGDPAAISSYLICQAAKRTLTVLLSGMGADEVFGGYPRQRALLYGIAFRRLPGWLRDSVRRAVGRLPATGTNTRSKVGRAGKKFLTAVERSPLQHYIAMETYFDDRLQRDCLAADGPLASVQDPSALEVAALAARIEANSHDDPLRQALLWDLVTYLPNLNLAYTDRTSMAHAVEVRVPFLDVDLVESSMRLRARDLIRPHGGRLHGKWILKQAAQSMLPRDVVWRPKAGFGAPVRAWLRSDLAEMREELLGAAGLGARRWFDPAGLRRLQDDFLSGRSDHALHIWMLMSLELWARAFIDRR